MVKEAEDLRKNHSQRGVTSPAYLQTQTEIKGLKLHNAQNTWMHYSLIEHVVHWLKIDRNLYGQLRQKFQGHKNKKQMDKTGYNGCDPFRQCMYKWFYHIRQHNMRTSSPNQQIMYFFLQSLQLPLYLYEAYDFIRQLTVNICAIFCCCGIEQWFSMDRMTG